MPFYEYECENCKFYTEILQKVSDEPLKKCPSCGKSAMKKLVSAPVFRLKGGGWYETDFKGDKENKRNLAVDKEPEASSESDSKAPKAAASDTKAADSKPAAESKAGESKASTGSASGGKARKASASRSAPAAPKARARPAARPKARPAPRKGK